MNGLRVSLESELCDIVEGTLIQTSNFLIMPLLCRAIFLSTMNRLYPLVAQSPNSNLKSLLFLFP